MSRATHTSAPVALPRGPRSLLATALVAAATCASMLALGDVLTSGSWLPVAALTVVALAVVTSTARSLARSSWAPSLVGLVALALGLLVRYGSPQTDLQLVPTPDSVERLLTQARTAADLIETSVVPMDVTRPVEMVMVAAAGLMFLVAELLTLGLRVPAWSGIVYLGAWAPAVALERAAPTRALVWTAVAYLLLLVLSAAPVGSRQDGVRRAVRAVPAAAGLVALTLAAGPLVAAAPGWATFSLPQLNSGTTGPLRLADDLDLRESLGDRSGEVVLRYTVRDAPGDESIGATTARDVGPLRSFTLQDFDGRSWERVDDADLSPWDPALLLASDAGLRGTAPDPGAGALAQVDVQIEALREQRLPVATFPRTVQIPGPWRYDEARDEIVGDRRTDAATAYSMTVQIPNLTADQLRDAGGDLPDLTDDFLDLPETDHTDDLRALAREIVGDADTAYAQALALQSWFRDSRNFVYDTSVDDAVTDDAVWDFVNSRRGYCVQFATSMAMLARSLGIPARLGVGFLPGTLDSDRTYVVTGQQAHAWPELYFPGAGWVRFEPTPAVQTGPPPEWSDPYGGATAAPEEDLPDAAAAPTAASPAPVATSSAGTGIGPSAPTPVDSGSLAWAAGLGGVVLALLVTAGVLAARRRAAAGAHLSPEAAWSRLRRRLARAGITWSDAQTPRSAVATIRARVLELRGEPLDHEADAALVSLADAVQSTRYAPHPAPVDRAVLESWVGAVLNDVSTGSGTSGGPGKVRVG
ncbi:transglutaminase family protein [Cellulomonas hominis]